MNEIQLVRLSVVKMLTGLSKSSIYARLNTNSPSFDPTFPRQAKLSPGPRGTAVWSLTEIQAWLISRLEARPSPGN